MKKIELFERAIAERAERLQDYGINSTAFWAYRKSIDAGNDLIDFSDVIWDHDIEGPDLRRQRHYRVYDQQHLLRPDSHPCSF